MKTPEHHEMTAVLIDRRNIDQYRQTLIDMMGANDEVAGIDLETDNRNAHAGIVEYGADGVFDLRRQIITGFSLYKDGTKWAFYFNLNQADAENRLTWEEVLPIVEAHKRLWIAHNAVFERTMMLTVLGYQLPDDRLIDTLQMAVSTYNKDEYDPMMLTLNGIQAFDPVIPRAAVAFADFKGRNNMTTEQAEVLGQVIGKSSRASFSYNGLVDDIAYGYGLKQAVRSHFGFAMQTYKETLNGKDGMADLTGEEVTSYGADDSYWAVRLFHHLKKMMLDSNPQVLKTFLTQENPMVKVYSEVWLGGVRINTKAVKERRESERAEYAGKLRQLRPQIKELLPFDDEPHAGLAKHDKAYMRNNAYERYRNRITDWVSIDDSQLTDYEVAKQVSGAVSESWTHEKGEKNGDLNFAYWMTHRVLMYDLFREKVILYKSKVQSDGDARGKLMERLSGTKLEVMKTLNEMVGIEQRMKLYLNPYLLLIDPETDKIYPQLSSMLNTRRMATSFPNPMQLSKRGESTYIRGFYLADEDDHVIVSLDWSSFELVIIGELSGDPEFASVFGQLPFGDLHTGAAVDCLRVTIPELTEELFNNLDTMSKEEVNAINPKILIDPSGNPLDPKKAKKFWRTIVGKGANFNYWYSGALSTVGDTLGWSGDTMWEATERYRTRFAVAEQWRQDTIAQLQNTGYLILPDGHRRVRYEATPEWSTFMKNQFSVKQQYLGLNTNALVDFGGLIVKSLQTRANNQGINALVQGTNAFVAKRSVLTIIKKATEAGLRFRFMFPVHDELVWSVHREDAAAFIKLAKSVMTDHPDIFKTLKLDCTPSVGLTFEPWSEKAKTGQIELAEIQADMFGFKRNQDISGDAESINRVIEGLYESV
jgi:DNA polymerase I-like protein with 3'-5' exonuclease and polymerase domains